MARGQYFNFKAPEDLEARAKALGLDREILVPREHPGALAKPFQAGPFALSNRFVIHPMEGWDGDPATGALTPDVERRWERMGESGAALCWGIEAMALDFAWRANHCQLVMRSENLGSISQGLKKLRAAHARAHGEASRLVVGAQLTCSGRFSFGRPKGSPLILVRHDPVFDKRVGADPEAPLTSDAELEEIAGRYALGARLAREAGFDFVDIKACHGYWLNETLAAKTRPGAYGGSFENRVKLMLMIVDSVRRETGDFPLGTRLSAFDGMAGAWATDDAGEPDTSEPIRLMGLLKAKGVMLFNLTAGCPYINPHLSRPTETPPVDGQEPPRDPLYEVARHLRLARELKAAHPDAVVVGTGYSYFRQFKLSVAENAVAMGRADLIGLGRAFLSYHDEAAELLRQGIAKPGKGRVVCTGDSSCTTGPRLGIKSGCVFDPYYSGTMREIRQKLAEKKS